MLHSSLVTQNAEFSGLRDEWFELLSRSTRSTVFDTFEWQFAWWNSIGKKIPFARLKITLLRDDSGLLVGILPFFTRMWPYLPVLCQQFLGAGTSDYHDVIAADGYEEAVVQELFSSLLQLSGWAIADLNQLKEDSTVRMSTLPVDFGQINRSEFRQELCTYLILPTSKEGQDSWELLLSRYSKKMRANVRYYNRALDNVYTVERLIASTAEEVHEAITSLFYLHQRRWNEKWLPGVFRSGAVRKFHKSVSISLMNRGWLRLHYLKLDGSIEAVLYCFSINKVTSYYQGGFEPSLSQLSLGSVLTGLAVKQAVAEGNSRFDFLRGDEPYKRRWTGNTTSWNVRWLVTRRGNPMHALAEIFVRIELLVEHRFKEWMHHRAVRRGANELEKGSQ